MSYHGALTTDDAEAMRARTAALLARADATLAAPRPSAEAVARADAERRASTPNPPASPSAARDQPVAVRARPAAGDNRPVSRASFDRRMTAMEAAIGEVVRVERMAWGRRVAEAERRLAVLEARLDGKP